jgi:hypothetical protein
VDTFTQEVPGFDRQIVERFPGPFSMGPHKIRGAICSDGVQRTATCSSAGADTFFSIPARVSVKGKTVSGYVTRESLEGFTVESPEDPAAWKFIAYTYGQNGALLPEGAYKRAPAAVEGYGIKPATL